MSVIPPTPQVFSTAKTNESSTTSSRFKPTSNSTQKFPSFPPPPSSVVPHPPVARAAPSAVPRAPSAIPHTSSAAPHASCAVSRASSAVPCPPTVVSRPPSATPHPPSPTPTLPTYPLLSVPHARSVKSTAPTLHDTLRNPLPTKRSVDLINDGDDPGIPSKRPRSTKGTPATLTFTDNTGENRENAFREPSAQPPSVQSIKQEPYTLPLPIHSHSIPHTGPYQDPSKPPLHDPYPGAGYPMYWSGYPPYNPYPGTHGGPQFPPPALQNQPSTYQNSHLLPPAASLHPHANLHLQPAQGSQPQPSNQISHPHLPPNSPYFYHPSQPSHSYHFPPAANYGPPVGSAAFQAPYPPSYNTPFEQALPSRQEGNTGKSSNGEAPV